MSRKTRSRRGGNPFAGLFSKTQKAVTSGFGKTKAAVSAAAAKTQKAAICKKLLYQVRVGEAAQKELDERKGEDRCRDQDEVKAGKERDAVARKEADAAAKQARQAVLAKHTEREQTLRVPGATEAAKKIQNLARRAATRTPAFRAAVDEARGKALKARSDAVHSRLVAQGAVEGGAGATRRKGRKSRRKGRKSRRKGRKSRRRGTRKGMRRKTARRASASAQLAALRASHLMCIQCLRHARRANKRKH